MDNLRGVLEYIKNYFTPLLIPDSPRKRRANEPVDFPFSTKCRRLQPLMSSRDYLNSLYLSPDTMRKSPRNRHIDTVVLDDDDDDLIEVFPKPSKTKVHGRPRINTFTSTPNADSLTNGVKNASDDDEITFVKEILSPNKKEHEASKRGFNYIRPFTGSLFRFKQNTNGSKTKDKCNLTSISRKSINISKPGVGSLDHSFRLDDKMQYKKLLEKAACNDSSIYSTPVGKLFNYDSSNRGAKMVNLVMKSPRMSTKDRIQKILDDFESEPVLLKDSDSDSDVIFVSPPSPKPDIKVDPVNSLKKIVDTSQPTKSDWLQEMVDRHKNTLAERQKEIDILRECSEKHNKINRDMRMEFLADKVNKSMQIKDIVLPVEEDEEQYLPELTDDHLKLVEKAFRGDPNEVLARKFNLNITRRDLQTLAGLNWLNDEVINFYMNMLIERGKDDKWPNVYAFNTFFYPKLIRDGPQSLRRWTKRVDLFSHDMVCIPIHLSMHWCMAIIDFRNKSIRYYDSMGGNNNKCLEALKNYLQAEHLDKRKTEYDTSDFLLENVKDIPQQMNGSDCGMFSCTFAEFLTRNAKITFNQENMAYFRKKMVVEIMSGELLIK